MLLENIYFKENTQTATKKFGISEKNATSMCSWLVPLLVFFVTPFHKQASKCPSKYLEQFQLECITTPH